MSHWRPYEQQKNSYYILVDSKPDEIVDLTNPERIFCTTFVSTASCFKGVRNSDLDWFKQYKECVSLEESKTVIRNLTKLFFDDNFYDLRVWVMSSPFSAIDRNGKAFLTSAADEVEELSVTEDSVQYKGMRFSANKASMLAWYNFCLCNSATFLVDQALRWGKTRALFICDRLGDSDIRIQKFMRMLMLDTSLHALWKRCAEDREKKPSYVRYEFASEYAGDSKVIQPACNTMQDSLVDWITLCVYAAKNGTENRDEKFQRLLTNFVRLLNAEKRINGVHITGDIAWN
jgi:hypothetical protein